MKLIPFTLVATGMLLCLNAEAQELTFKTDYIGSSGYYYLPPGEKPRVKIGNGRGSVAVLQGAVNIPLSKTLNENNRPTVWGIGFGGAYASLSNKGFKENMVSEIMDLQLSIYHQRPLNDKWSMRASAGIGIFAPTTDFGKIGFKNVLASGSLVFIYHLKPNLYIGGGIAINSSLGYPMIFPSVYIKWKLNGKFDVNVEVIEGLDISVGYKFNNRFKLSYALAMNGQVALLKKDGADMIFSHQYIVTGLRPEIKFSETGLSLFGMVGLNLYRPATYSNRTLKGVFASDNDYYFSASPYVSVGLRLYL